MTYGYKLVRTEVHRGAEFKTAPSLTVHPQQSTGTED